GTAREDLITVINTNFDPLWESNDPRVGDHFKTFSSMNGYVIKAGSVNSIITYSYEQTYYWSSMISYSAWTFGVIMILGLWIDSRKISKRITAPGTLDKYCL